MTTEAKTTHTRGPWLINGARLLSSSWVSIEARKEGSPYPATIAECRGNEAHLIAAAPEMLEALERAHDALMVSALGSSSPEEAATAQELMEVIQKAKGETS